MLPWETECAANTDSLCWFWLRKREHIYTHVSVWAYRNTYMHTPHNSRSPKEKPPCSQRGGQRAFFWPLKRFSKARFDIHLGKVRAQPPAWSKLSRRQRRARGVCLGKQQVVCAWLHSAACEPQGICGQNLSWERKFLEIQKSGKLPEDLGIRRASAAPVTSRELQQSQGWGEELSAWTTA